MRKKCAIASQAQENAESVLKTAHDQITSLNSDILEKVAELENVKADLEISRKTADEKSKHAADITSEVKKIAERNTLLEADSENLKLELIKQKSELTEKFTVEREKLIEVSTSLETALDEEKRRTDEAETLAADRLGRVGKLELEIVKYRDVSDELKSKMSEISENFENLQTDFQAESENSEKKLKARERQVNELKKELQRNIEKEKDVKVKESVKEEKVQNSENSNGFQEEPPVDINYLKHVVLRYITAPAQDREHLIKEMVIFAFFFKYFLNFFFK